MSIRIHEMINAMRNGTDVNSSGHAFVEFSPDRKWYRVLARPVNPIRSFTKYIGWRAFAFGRTGEEPFIISTPFNADPRDYISNTDFRDDDTLDKCDSYKLITGMEPSENPDDNIVTSYVTDKIQDIIKNNPNKRYINIDKYNLIRDQRMDTFIWYMADGGFFKKSRTLKGHYQDEDEIQGFKIPFYFWRNGWYTLGAVRDYMGDDCSAFGVWESNRYERPKTKLELLFMNGFPIPARFQNISHIEYAEIEAKKHTLPGFMKAYPFVDDIPALKKAYRMRHAASATLFLFGGEYRSISTSYGRICFKQECVDWLFRCSGGNFIDFSIKGVHSTSEEDLSEIRETLYSDYGITEDPVFTTGLLEKFRAIIDELADHDFTVKSLSYMNPRRNHRRSRSDISKFGIYDFEIVADHDGQSHEFSLGDDASTIKHHVRHGKTDVVDFQNFHSLVASIANRHSSEEESFEI